jgi:hypothetical protein
VKIGSSAATAGFAATARRLDLSRAAGDPPCRREVRGARASVSGARELVFLAFTAACRGER